MLYFWYVVMKSAQKKLLLASCALLLSVISLSFLSPGISRPEIALAATTLSSGASVNAAFSFGGRIAYLYTQCLNGAIYAYVIQPPPKQPSAIAVIWTPATITYRWGPPKSIGQSILGLFDSPYQCVVSYYPYYALSGLRMRMIGTSPI